MQGASQGFSSSATSSIRQLCLSSSAVANPPKCFITIIIFFSFLFYSFFLSFFLLAMWYDPPFHSYFSFMGFDHSSLLLSFQSFFKLDWFFFLWIWYLSFKIWWISIWDVEQNKKKLEDKERKREKKQKSVSESQFFFRFLYIYMYVILSVGFMLAISLYYYFILLFFVITWLRCVFVCVCALSSSSIAGFNLFTRKAVLSHDTFMFAVRV